jgi:hypothetical protein
MSMYCMLAEPVLSTYLRCANDKLSADEVEEVQALFQEQWCETYISPLKSFF